MPLDQTDSNRPSAHLEAQEQALSGFHGELETLGQNIEQRESNNALLKKNDYFRFPAKAEKQKSRPISLSI